jgi:haloalkane dehalogenase
LRFRERVDQLKIFLDRLNIDDFSLVMHDWGGPIGSAMAMDRFPALRRLVYFNTTLTEVASLPKLIRWSAAPLVGRFLTQWSDRFIRFTTELGVVKPLSSQDRAGYFWPYPDSRSRRAIYDFVQDIPFTAGHPSWKDLELLRSQLVKLSSLPVQIIWGLKDPCFHKLMLERVAAHFPKAEVHSFEDASHLVLEDKASEVAVLLDEFLSRPNVV